MCGIVGILGTAPAAPRLLAALRRLEYRGYDSAGLATLDATGAILRRRTEGKLDRLAASLEAEPLPGCTGIGHTRWATHGAPVERNAHPHATQRVAVVHNGIIENFAELRAELEAEGQRFSSDTDTEAVVQLLDLLLARGMAPEAAAQAALRRLRGAFAMAFLFAGRPDLLIAARHGPALAVGWGEGGEMFLGNDALALGPLARAITYLEDGDWAVLTPGAVSIMDLDGRPVARPRRPLGPAAVLVEKGNHRHFMEKELHEHPAALGDTLQQYLDPAARSVMLPHLPFDPCRVPSLTITACGSAFLAGLVGKYWIEQLARIPVEADVASEWRYRDPPLPEGGGAILVSQSGETADTLAALKLLRERGQKVLSIVNVPDSTLARQADAALLTAAGPEVGVASTKAFTAQLMVLASLAIGMARARGAITAEAAARLTAELLQVPGHAAAILDRHAEIESLAHEVARARDVLFLGRGNLYPIALEGALKLKEISYIHAEGYAAGEMKHGPIALIDDLVPVISLAPSGPLFEKTLSNLQEAAARGGRIMAFTDAAGAPLLERFAERVVVLPAVSAFAAPLLHAIPVQLLAYHVAVLRGTDVDQPRNLAKSVTVE
ncbi:MAG: glutamine--fructose-6-phosphate transaminase (isomerizing) [Rhodovarius sp.]|nr:glutamine--fructose-6-phosphate transaminase (isomerizing) [Rhodovarius sp.]MCX7932979.1 glutamine--fructose-6-phosphate transaminase (isomerizing) [Rhodovarius sp.]MDW8313755.1 glutamine--fructose-6-phosphate transaminase (isomerizing) [Rhodovarius sp.]